MNDEENKLTPEDMEDNPTAKESGIIPLEDTSNKPVKAPAHHRVTVLIMLIFVCLVTAGSYMLWKELQQIKSDIQASIEKEQVQNSSISENLAAMEASIAQLGQKQIEQAEVITSLYQDKRESNEDWAIAEVEYLLITAMHRLLLEDNVKTALAAMEAADLRLENMGNPGLLPVRRQLAADINQLRSVNLVDIASLAIYLSEFVGLSDDLPLKQSAISKETGEQLSQANMQPDGQDAEPPWWLRLPRLLWQELKSLVVIKRTGEVKQALLLPSEEYFLYQNLKLELESARQSVLRSDSENLRSSINFIQTWMRRYFDTSDSAVVNMMETLDRMSTLELKPALPDISSSLESLRAYVRETASDTEDTDGIQAQ